MASHSQHHMPYSVLHGINNPSANFINQGGSGFDFGELEEAIILQGVMIRNDEAKPPLLTVSGRPAAATLEMFPSLPMRSQQHTRKVGSSKSDSGSEMNTFSSKVDPEASTSDQNQMQQNQSPAKFGINKRKGLTSEKPLDAKTLRRLAQNREAAKKSRLRKKAYVQQLESSRIKLTQLEQELQRVRQQGLLLGGYGGAGGNTSPGAIMFDMEYARWLEDDHRHMSELRTGLHAHLTDGDLRVIVDRYITHYDQIFRIKGMAAKSDVFHLITGMWSTPAERCFLWMGGFRPSELIKMLVPQMDQLTEQQLMGIYSLQNSSQQAEEALTQGLNQLRQSLIDTVTVRPAAVEGMQQMAMALGKLANVEGFVRQADNLRQQTLHQLRLIFTVRQAVRCFLVIGEYYGRLRALSSLWTSRSREASMGEDNSCQTSVTEFQMMQSLQHHFRNF